MTEVLDPDDEIHCLYCGSLNVNPEWTGVIPGTNQCRVIVKCIDCLSTEVLEVTSKQIEWLRVRMTELARAEIMAMVDWVDNLSEILLHEKDVIFPADLGYPHHEEDLGLEIILEMQADRRLQEAESEIQRFNKLLGVCSSADLLLNLLL